jgi:hypothetical protein
MKETSARRGAALGALLVLISFGCSSRTFPNDGDAGGGDTGGCPPAPATNDPACHPEDSSLYNFDSEVFASGGACATGLTCQFLVGAGLYCDQFGGFETFVCCPTVFPAYGPYPIPQTGFVPGSTTAACPAPLPAQDPACALPLASTCAIEGLQCKYTSHHQCQNCSTLQTTITCCTGSWKNGAGCPSDAGAD